MFFQINPASQFLPYKSSHCIRFQATNLSLNVELSGGAKGLIIMRMHYLTPTSSCHLYRSNFRRTGSCWLHVRCSCPTWWPEEGTAVGQLCLQCSSSSHPVGQETETGTEVGLHCKPQRPACPWGPTSLGRPQLNGLQPPKTPPLTRNQVYTRRHT